MFPASHQDIEGYVEDAELEALLNDLESDRVERKESLSDREKIRQAICAFANDLPNHQKAGVLFIGVKDDGGFSGIEITDQLLRDLGGFAREGTLLPMPFLTVEKRHLRGHDIAVAVVQPADAPPVRYKGRVWIRIGPRRAGATPEEERRLAERSRGRNLPFDLQPVAGSSLADLDLEFFLTTYLPAAVDPDAIAQNGRTNEQKLASLRLLAPPPDSIPTLTGVLTLGVRPLDFVPCAFVQFVRFDGTRLTDPIKSAKEIGGRLDDVLRRLDEILESNVSVGLTVLGRSTELREPDYPLEALRQLVRNAVLHRIYEGTHAPIHLHWFSDRIEIQNPGGPYGTVNRANFGQPGIVDYRNPNLAEALRNLGFIQRFGLGIQIAREQLTRNGNPELEFRVEETHVLAVVGKKP
jgi:ATP-dependent DNA helicase RecG